MGKIKQIKALRHQVRKERREIAFSVVEQIYGLGFWERFKIAFNILIKKGDKA